MANNLILTISYGFKLNSSLEYFMLMLSYAYANLSSVNYVFLKIRALSSYKSFSKDVALLSLIVIVLQSSSFVFVWLCIVLRCWLLLSVLFDEQIRELLLAATGRPKIKLMYVPECNSGDNSRIECRCYRIFIT